MGMQHRDLPLAFSQTSPRCREVTAQKFRGFFAPAVSFLISYFPHPQARFHFKINYIYSLIGSLTINIKYVQGKLKRTRYSQNSWSAIRYGVKGGLIIMPGNPTAKNEGVLLLMLYRSPYLAIGTSTK